MAVQRVDLAAAAMWPYSVAWGLLHGGRLLYMHTHTHDGLSVEWYG
jgi:hypothetical protein